MNTISIDSYLHGIPVLPSFSGVGSSFSHLSKWSVIVKSFEEPEIISKLCAYAMNCIFWKKHVNYVH